MPMTATRRLLAMVVVAVLLAFAPVYHAICVTMASEQGTVAHVMADGSTMVMASTDTAVGDYPAATIPVGNPTDALALLGTVLIVAGVAIAVAIGLRFCAARARPLRTVASGPRPHPDPPDRNRRRARAPVNLIALSISRT